MSLLFRWDFFNLVTYLVSEISENRVLTIDNKVLI